MFIINCVEIGFHIFNLFYGVVFSDVGAGAAGTGAGADDSVGADTVGVGAGVEATEEIISVGVITTVGVGAVADDADELMTVGVDVLDGVVDAVVDG